MHWDSIVNVLFSFSSLLLCSAHAICSTFFPLLECCDDDEERGNREVEKSNKQERKQNWSRRSCKMRRTKDSTLLKMGFYVLVIRSHIEHFSEMECYVRLLNDFFLLLEFCGEVFLRIRAETDVIVPSWWWWCSDNVLIYAQIYVQCCYYATPTSRTSVMNEQVRENKYENYWVQQVQITSNLSNQGKWKEIPSVHTSTTSSQRLDKSTVN